MLFGLSLEPLYGLMRSCGLGRIFPSLEAPSYQQDFGDYYGDIPGRNQDYYQYGQYQGFIPPLGMGRADPYAYDGNGWDYGERQRLMGRSVYDDRNIGFPYTPYTTYRQQGPDYAFERRLAALGGGVDGAVNFPWNNGELQRQDYDPRYEALLGRLAGGRDGSCGEECSETLGDLVRRDRHHGRDEDRWPYLSQEDRWPYTGWQPSARKDADTQALLSRITGGEDADAACGEECTLTINKMLKNNGRHHRG